MPLKEKVYEIAGMLREKGIFTIAIVYSAVRTKEAKWQVCVLTTHKNDQSNTLIPH